MLIRFLLLVFLITVHAARAGDAGEIDASPALFTVLAALNAAGYDADLGSAANHPLRAMVRKRIAAKDIPVMRELKGFFERHRQKDPAAELNQYVSFALTVEGPPAFNYRLKPQELPPDVIELDGFEKLLARFYQEADVEALWLQAQPAFDEAIARYQRPVSQALLEVNGYLRNPTSGYLGRSFRIYLDLLGAPNQIQSRSYLDDFFIVLTPSPEPQIFDIRHAYLHYLLDPLSIKYSKELNEKASLGDYALPAPALDESYKSDFLLLATECLIKAVESRLDKKPAAVEQALREGLILTPHFAEQLAVYEKQEEALRLFFPKMVEAISFRREEKRLDNVQFAAGKPVRKAKEAALAPRAVLAGPEKTFEEAEQAYIGKEYSRAQELYRKVLEESTDKLLQTKAYYGLARIAIFQKDPALAEKLFQKALDSSPDPQTAAWAHIYLARLADLEGERDQAVQHYRAVAGIAGAPESARQIAEKGLREAFQKK